MAVGMVVLIVPLAGMTTPAGAATEPFSLTMDEGEVFIRGAEEPAALESPTVISGTNTDGNLTGVSFTTPTISFERPVTDPVPTTAFIDASFNQVTPGASTGSISPEGDVTISAALRVDLDIQVEILAGQEFHCTTQPVNLVMTGDHDGNGIILDDGDFTVPAAPITEDCPDFIAEAINEQLQGGGHSLSLTMDGALTRPIAPGDPTDTSLIVTPAEPTDVGQEITLTATVVPEATGDTGIPQGLVSFRDGSTEIGTAPLDANGVASFATSDLLAGTRSLTARYTGSPPDYDVSTSSIVSHQVIAAPMVVAELPSTVLIGGSPVGFEVEATNTGFGRTLQNARLDVVIQRVGGTSPIAPVSGTPRVVLESTATGSPVDVPLVSSGSGSGQRLRGSLGDPADLGIGDSLTKPLQMKVQSIVPGTLRLTFNLVTVDGGGVVLSTLASASGDTLMVEAERRESTVEAGYPGDDFFPPVAPITPVAARPGASIQLSEVKTGPSSAGLGPSGTLEFFVDNRQVAAKAVSAGADGAYELQAPIGSTGSGNNYWVALPTDLGPGTHMVTVAYSGNAFFRPSAGSWPVRIDTRRGSTVECKLVGPGQAHFFANVEVFATVPASVRPGTVALDDLRVVLLAPRAGLTFSLPIFSDPASTDGEFTVELGPDGSGDATGAVVANSTDMAEEDGLGTDHSVTLTGEQGEVTVAGDPGDEVDVTFDSLHLGIVSDGGFLYTLDCTPVGDPAVIGATSIAGTTVAVSPSVAAPGQDVTLTATSLPGGTGTVEFLDGSTTIGVVSTTNGVATMRTSTLAYGPHAIKAIFRPTPSGPTLTSVTVTVTVIDCAAFAEEGNGAVVRLVYMELLGRCPDQGGFDYWVDRLDGGTSPEVFARAIARQPEAVGQVVDDAYQTMLGRTPDAEGRAFWVDRLGTNGRYDQLLADLAASPEFWSLAGSTNEGFVTRVYGRLLNRSPDQGGLDYWVGRLDTGTSRKVLVRSLANQAEPLGVLVADSYDEILDRAPDADERTAGIGHLRSTGDRSGLYAQLIGRPEFVTRAQAFPNPD